MRVDCVLIMITMSIKKQEKHLELHMNMNTICLIVFINYQNGLDVCVCVLVFMLGCDSSLSECPWHYVTFPLCARRADAGRLSGGVADMVRQGVGRRAKTVPASTSDLLAHDQHACAIQPANTPLYAAGRSSKPCPAPLCREDNERGGEEGKTLLGTFLVFILYFVKQVP